MSTFTENSTLQLAQIDSQTIETSELTESKEGLNSRLGDLVNSAPVMLFMKGVPKCPLCRFSRRIVRILNDHGIQYGSFNVLQDETIREGIKEYADWPTFPQLWVNGELVGGLDIVKEEFAANPEFLNTHEVPEIENDATQELV
ncbi:Grx4 family monothiol glutaredoxin [Fusarium phyllophilum]|uniref:Grx4 family monothiol glutaredoxin n=1 Tax=Fusarium phyllophilum TaxID=47803 RepID=A0A8H5K8L4_9HYPO|nr:Grx4 family monothiol glutaredoxin [Fusarium phyllophilum]